jgi:O-methyltransferase involved in polyketide biosynthesis
VFTVTNAALALARKPPLPPMLLHRHAMLDRIAREHSGPRIIELAAGLSPRGAAMTRASPITYIEVDLPAMIAKKRELFARTAEGRAALDRLALVAGDALTLDLAPLAPAVERTLVIAEGLCMYLSRPARATLFAKVAALSSLCGEVELAFDLVPAAEEPAPGLSGRILAALLARVTGGARFERDARTREDVLEELRAAGFHTARAIAARDVARAWQLPQADRTTTPVVFIASARDNRA